MPAPDGSKLCRRKALPQLTNRISIKSSTNSPTNQPGLICLRAYSLLATDFLPYAVSVRAPPHVPLSINFFPEVRQIVLRAVVDGRHELIAHRASRWPDRYSASHLSNHIFNTAQSACQCTCCVCEPT